MKVYLQRLLELTGYTNNEIGSWDDIDKSITVNEVKEALKCGVAPIELPYGDAWKYPFVEKDRDYHIGRVAYFVLHPDKISSIGVTNDCYHTRYGSHILPNCLVLDGHHRLMAAMIHALNKVDIDYGGREDVIDYLMGASNEAPVEMI